jgi:phenylpyruvate tautomerase PptA (4-oxalocrotonate tautomerase family)
VRDYVPTDDELLARVAYRVAEAFLEVGNRDRTTLYLLLGDVPPPPTVRAAAALAAKNSFKAVLGSPAEPPSWNPDELPSVTQVWASALDSMGWGWGKDREANMELADQLEERWTAGVVSALERWRLGLPERVSTEPR